MVEEYDGQAERIWTEATDADGPDEADDFSCPGLASRSPRSSLPCWPSSRRTPEGWESVVGDYSQEGYRSVADVVDVASLEKVRAYKKEKKAAARG